MGDRPRRIALTLALVAGLAAGCGDRPTETPPPPTMPEKLVARCGDLRLPLEVLSNPLGAEREGTPEADALRRYVQGRIFAGEDPPVEEYRLLRSNPGDLLYGSSGEVFALISVRNVDGRWTAGAAGTCAPTLELPGLDAATWNLPLDVAPAPDLRRFSAEVSEVPCVGGRVADGRILPPLLMRQMTQVVVIFAIVPPPATGGPMACPRAPPARYEVDLGEPLGGRELLDGSTIPPRSPEQASCCG
jgi:hypothetical protein